MAIEVLGYVFDLKELTLELGRVPTTLDLIERKCYTQVRDAYGGLKKALQAEGLWERRAAERSAGKYVNLIELALSLGRVPTMKDLKDRDCYTKVCMEYGGLNNALRAQGLWDRKLEER